MVDTKVVTINLPIRLLEHIEEKAVDSGLYSTKSDFIVSSIKNFYVDTCDTIHNRLIEYVAICTNGSTSGPSRNTDRFTNGVQGYVNHSRAYSYKHETWYTSLLDGPKKVVSLRLPMGLWEKINRQIGVMDDLHSFMEFIHIAVYRQLVSIKVTYAGNVSWENLDENGVKQLLDENFPNGVEEYIKQSSLKP